MDIQNFVDKLSEDISDAVMTHFEELFTELDEDVVIDHADFDMEAQIEEIVKEHVMEILNFTNEDLMRTE